jgi:hypothetical protein
MGAYSGAVGGGTVLQAGRLWVLFPMRSLDFLTYLTFQPHYGPRIDSASNSWHVRLTMSPPSVS